MVNYANNLGGTLVLNDPLMISKLHFFPSISACFKWKCILKFGFTKQRSLYWISSEVTSDSHSGDLKISKPVLWFKYKISLEGN